MSGEKFTIAKTYKIFEGEKATGDPIDEPSEQHLYAWLLARGFTEAEAVHIVNQADDDESVTITIP